jgi:hypothetical protein
MQIKASNKKLKILDFDLENRPISYAGNDFTFSDVTAIAASFVGSREVKVWAIPEVSYEEMLAEFKIMYDKADMVTGHNIRKHDLPILRGAMLEFGIGILSPKLTSDTYLDLISFSGVSKSQENLSDMYGLPASKFHMNQNSWRQANRLTAEGIALTKKRVISDVKQHKQLRNRLIEANALRGPKMWTGKSTFTVGNH